MSGRKNSWPHAREVMAKNIQLPGEIRESNKNFLVIEVANCVTPDTHEMCPEGVLNLVRYQIDEKVRVSNKNFRRFFSRQNKVVIFFLKIAFSGNLSEGSGIH